jgi:hypothetical protein
MPFADLIKSRSGIDYPALGEAPGTFYHYNNWDFNAAGTIFEQKTGNWCLEGDHFG